MLKPYTFLIREKREELLEQNDVETLSRNARTRISWSTLCIEARSCLSALAAGDLLLRRKIL